MVDVKEIRGNMGILETKARPLRRNNCWFWDDMMKKQGPKQVEADKLKKSRCACSRMTAEHQVSSSLSAASTLKVKEEEEEEARDEKKRKALKKVTFSWLAV